MPRRPNVFSRSFGTLASIHDRFRQRKRFSLHAATRSARQGGLTEVLEGRTLFALTYWVDPNGWPDAGRRDAAVASIQSVVNRYNAYGDFNWGNDGNIEVFFNAGVPTAQANPGGSITFGGTYPNERVMLHESNHWMGTVYWHDPNGPQAVALLEQFNGVGARFGSDGTHFWDYGMNYDNEFSEVGAQRNIAVVYAFRRDWGIGNPNDPAAWAATNVTLNASDALGESGFNHGSKWSDNTFAHYNADYSTGAFDLRTPQGYPSWRFAGKSLTVNSGGRLLYNGWGTTGNVTIDNLTLSGGSTVRHDQNAQDSFNLNSNNLTVSGATTFNAGKGPIRILAPMSGTGSITVTGPYDVTLLGNNTYSGGTTVLSGTLTLGASERIANNSAVTLAGGVFATAGFSETLGSLSLSGNSTIDVGGGASTVKFSGAGSFASGKTLNLLNWGPGDRLFVGTSAVLTSAQLAQISFNGGAAIQLSTGEIVRASSAAPTVAVAAASNASPVTGTTATLSVLGADDGGEGALIYSWSATGPAGVTFSSNLSNAAKNTTATFGLPGTYTFMVTLSDAGGMTTTSSVNVTVNSTPTAVAISPSSTTVGPNGTQQFTAAVTNQFGGTIANPSVTWSLLSGGGSISTSGLYTAPATTGTATVRALAGSASATAVVATASSEEVAYYKADETTGSVLIDGSGHGKTASLNGGYTLGAGRTNGALTLNGGYASLPNGIVSSLTDFTVSTWVKIPNLTDWTRIFDFGTGTGTYMFLSPRAGGTGLPRFAITTGGGGGEQQINSNTAITANTWTHIAVTRLGNTGTLYINGVAVGSSAGMTLSPSSLGSTGNNYIGRSQYADPNLQGSLDDFRIYSRALTSSEIASQAATASNSAPTVATAASASQTSVNGTSTKLSVLGADDFGEGNLTYTWSASGPAGVSYSANGTAAAKNAVASFTAAGTYTFTVTITDNGNLTTTSSINVTVNSVPTAMTITPAMPTVGASTTQQFTASVTNQFGAAVANPATTWSVLSGGGSITSGGAYTAPATAASVVVQATVSGLSATAVVRVVSVSEELAYYKVDENAGPTLFDSSGHNKNASLTGTFATIQAGQTSRALALADNAYASLPAGIMSSATNFTVATWVNIQTAADWTRIFDFGTGTGAYMFLSPRVGGTGLPRFAITTSGGGGEQQINSNTAIPLNTWTHIAVTRSGSTATMYINGVAVGTNTGMTLSPANLGTTGNNYIGKSQYPDPGLTGFIDEFRLFARALTSAELQAISGATPPSVPLAPSNLTGSKVVGQRRASLSWKDNSTDETGFRIWSSRDGVNWSLLATRTAGSGSGSTQSYTTGTLATGQWYFRVSSYNANGDSAFTNVAGVFI